MAIPKTTPELLPSYKYVMTPDDVVMPATPDAITTPGTSTAVELPTTPDTNTAASTTTDAVAETTETRTTMSNPSDAAAATTAGGATPTATASADTAAAADAAAATGTAMGAAMTMSAADAGTGIAAAATKASASEATTTTTVLAAATSIEDAGPAGPTFFAQPEDRTEVGTTTAAAETVTTVAGEFGMSADWREAISMPRGGHKGGVSLRDDTCLTEEKQQDVHEILRRRKATPSESKVAACVRTKDFGRFLPEWIAFHYAVGVDEITVYDDDSVDDTKEVLQPFVDAGMVLYLFEEIGELKHEMRPLNHCLDTYLQRRKNDSSAPAWITFHDTDEYLFPVQTNVTISEAFMEHSATCCLHVPRVQYGTGGHREMPRGLVLETFLTHASPHNVSANRIPKVMVNLAPDDPLLGAVIPPLKSMHNANGCICDNVPVTEMRINHYLGSTEDYLERTKRAWQDGYNREKVQRIVEERDINGHTSDTITAWSCATREVLARVVEGIPLEFGLE